MGSNKLVTSSLIGSIEWMRTAPSSVKKDDPDQRSWKQVAFDDLHGMLIRKPWAPTPEITHGIDFEDAVYNSMKHGHTKGSKEYLEILAGCRGGSVQDVLKGDVNIDGTTYFLYGKTDVLFDNLIVDIKTTKSYKPNKYLSKVQHLIYCYLSKIKNFKYIIAEWDTYPKIHKVHYEDYTAPGPCELEQILFERITKAMDFLKTRPILWKAYEETYCRKKH